MLKKIAIFICLGFALLDFVLGLGFILNGNIMAGAAMFIGTVLNYGAYTALSIPQKL